MLDCFLFCLFRRYLNGHKALKDGIFAICYLRIYKEPVFPCEGSVLTNGPTGTSFNVFDIISIAMLILSTNYCYAIVHAKHIS